MDRKRNSFHVIPVPSLMMSVRHFRDASMQANDESEGHSLRDHNGDVNGSAGGVRALAVVGGVAANKELRRRLQVRGG